MLKINPFKFRFIHICNNLYFCIAFMIIGYAKVLIQQKKKKKTFGEKPTSRSKTRQFHLPAMSKKRHLQVLARFFAATRADKKTLYITKRIGQNFG